MNKLTKAAIAGAAGIALLLGGAGSLAVWNDSTDFAADSITAGTLTVATDGDATTFYQNTTDEVDLIVPGDVVVVTQPLEISASGDNLLADLSIDTLTFTGALKDKVTLTWGFYAGTTLVSTSTHLDASTLASITKVVATVTFPSTTDDTEGQGEALDLGTLKVLVTQYVA